MGAHSKRGAGVVPLILKGGPHEAGEILRSVTFVETEGRGAVRTDARRWPRGRVAAFLEAHPAGGGLDPDAAHGYSFAVGSLSIDLLWFPELDGLLFYGVADGDGAIRRLHTQAAEGPWVEVGGDPEPARAAGVRRPTSLLAVLAPAKVVRGAVGFVSRFEQEPYWQAEAVVAGAIWLFLGLTKKLNVGPVWLMPGCEALLLAALVYTAPGRSIQIGRRPRTRTLPRLALGLVGLVNTGQLSLLVHELLVSKVKGSPGHALILAAVVIWLTNIVIFALAFWELDRGGPDRRSDPSTEGKPDFLFSQMAVGGSYAAGFRPSFFDYLYTASTNATAFSPTDTMPLGAAAKGLMLAQALASLVTVGLVAARAVNILT